MIKELKSLKISSLRASVGCVAIQSRMFKHLRVEELKSYNNGRSPLMNSSPLHRFISSTRTQTKFAFTMAEILLSLTIIGVVAAITLPSLTGNINERTWNTQRKALYARMSQAIALMPYLNGYGIGADDTATINNAAETFITNGLSKVLKINNICNNSHLEDCGLASQIIATDATKTNIPKEIGSLNPGIISTYGFAVVVKNTKAAAFETANGESILTFYNPNCTAGNVLVSATSDYGDNGQLVKQHVCANFIYDLNGKKGPNTVGKDIGAITVVNSSDSNVVMPLYPKSVAGTADHSAASNACRNIDEGQYRLPNIDELLSLYYNRILMGDTLFGSASFVWSGTGVTSGQSYTFGSLKGVKYPMENTRSSNIGIVCVQR